jgi:hypothetical protein
MRLQIIIQRHLFLIMSFQYTSQLPDTRNICPRIRWEFNGHLVLQAHSQAPSDNLTRHWVAIFLIPPCTFLSPLSFGSPKQLWFLNLKGSWGVAVSLCNCFKLRLDIDPIRDQKLCSVWSRGDMGNSVVRWSQVHHVTFNWKRRRN